MKERVKIKEEEERREKREKEMRERDREKDRDRTRDRDYDRDRDRDRERRRDRDDDDERRYVGILLCFCTTVPLSGRGDCRLPLVQECSHLKAFATGLWNCSPQASRKCAMVNRLLYK